MKTSQDFNKIYYRLKPFLPRWLQIWVRGSVVRAKRKRFSRCWPILHGAGRRPEIWPGWPDQKRFAVILTHDVESQQGLANCRRVAEMEMKLGFRSSFNLVVQRYRLPALLRYELENTGFEIGVHGVYHDGKLFQSWENFSVRASIINYYLKKWNAVGFRSPSMHHNLEWLHELNILYDMSTFDTDPFEPQSDGVATIFPFWVDRNGHTDRYLEMPYTLAQDFTLFILMKERSTRVWREKLDWIYNHGGMALLNTHPDYMAFEGEKKSVDQYPAELYLDFLQYVRSEYQGVYWHTLPKDMAKYYYESTTAPKAGGLDFRPQTGKTKNTLSL
jgi:peptidoglycan/xylan/chitin deacetylase (PgdA/CDA1 family)